MTDIDTLVSIVGVALPVILALFGGIAAYMKKYKDNAVEKALRDKTISMIADKLDKLPCEEHGKQIALAKERYISQQSNSTLLIIIVYQLFTPLLGFHG